MYSVPSLNCQFVALAILSLMLISNPAMAFDELSKDSIKLYPEQSQICTEMSELARGIQQYRKSHPKSRLSDYESTVSRDDLALEVKFVMAFKIYESGQFATNATPDEVASHLNSHCVGTFQLINANSLKS